MAEKDREAQGEMVHVGANMEVWGSNKKMPRLPKNFTPAH